MKSKSSLSIRLLISITILSITLLLSPDHPAKAKEGMNPDHALSSLSMNGDIFSDNLWDQGSEIQASTVVTATETVTPPDGYERPLLVVLSYGMSQDTISPGDSFTLFVKLYNAGQQYALNIRANFTAGDLIPRETGGVVAVGEIAPGNRKEFDQPFILSSEMWAPVASLTMQITYYDESGTAYNDSFVISLPVFLQYYVAPTATPTPTQTPIPSFRPQLVIIGYATDVTPLQPGIQFNLSLDVKNMGSATAKRVTMIVGGGSGIPGGDGGTQQPGGISGASGEFTNFAPIGSSNVQSLGEFEIDGSLTAFQPLIVNVNTSPGAYPLKISFVYLDENNHMYTDDQVITLLVYRLPLLEINFYQAVPPMYTFQPNMLPLQVVNLGRNTVVLGTMRVTADVGQFSNNSILVGTLDPGGYFTLDASFTPDQPGTVDLVVTIDYTDDFNFPQVVSKTMAVEIIDQPIIEPPVDGGEVINGGVPPAKPETFLQKVWRLLLGLFGLDSGPSSTQSPGGEIPKETPIPQDQPIIIPGPKGF